ncbi:hypothetical protein PWY87_04945 [Kribbella solani]|uniref:hypothetical protein n=1 Tax=Kribbella solani TaxID=236067 RepID=UPI0029BE17B3|nr:hypothetical protein [Kribbella solani]MDX3001006.1 hypothetical protein [Kribbella solani]
MTGGDPYLDGVARKAIAESIAAGVIDFGRVPDSRVLVIEQSSAGRWPEYVERVADAFGKTDELVETLRRSLPGFDRDPVRRSHVAALDALTHPDAQYAVVAEVGDNGPLTVVSFEQVGMDLVVVGGGTTFQPPPPPPRTPKAAARGVPGDIFQLSDELAGHVARLRGEQAGGVSPAGGEEAGCAVQYALATIAGRNDLRIVHRVSPDGWYGPRTLRGRRMIGTDGLTRSTRFTAQEWEDADAEEIAHQVTLRQDGARHPYPEIDNFYLAPADAQRWATQLSAWLGQGGAVEVYDHGDPDQRFASGLAVLELESGGSLDERDPIPDRAGVRTIVARTNGRPQAAVTFGRRADGDLQVLRFLRSGHPGADQATELMLFEAAMRDGGGLSLSRGVEIQYVQDQQEYSISAAEVDENAEALRGELGRLDDTQADRMARQIAALDVAGVPAVDPDALAARVQRFREAGGDVLFLDRFDPAFEDWRQKATDRLAAAMDPEGSVPPDVESLWRVFNPPIAEPGRPSVDTQWVTVAVVDGVPVAAAGVWADGHRYELRDLGVVDGADDALVAAVVDGVYAQGSKTEPLTMFVTDAEANSEQLAELGLKATAVRPLDDVDRVEIRLSEPTRSAIRAAVDAAGWWPAVELDFKAEDLSNFEQKNGTVWWLDHGITAERHAAEEFIQAVQEHPDRTQPELPVPPVNGDRFTVLARSGNDSAYVTFDETPGGEIEVVDIAAGPFGQSALDAVQFGLSGELAARGQDAVLHERITSDDRERGIWDAARSRYLVTGMENRLGDLATGMLRPPPAPAPDAAMTTEAGQGAAAGQAPEAEQGGQGDVGGKAADPGNDKPPHRPDGRGGRQGGPER